MTGFHRSPPTTSSTVEETHPSDVLRSLKTSDQGEVCCSAALDGASTHRPQRQPGQGTTPKTELKNPAAQFCFAQIAKPGICRFRHIPGYVA
jgi:hypothetical protein